MRFRFSFFFFSSLHPSASFQSRISSNEDSPSSTSRETVDWVGKGRFYLLPSYISSGRVSCRIAARDIGCSRAFYFFLLLRRFFFPLYRLGWQALSLLSPLVQPSRRYGHERIFFPVINLRGLVLSVRYFLRPRSGTSGAISLAHLRLLCIFRSPPRSLSFESRTGALNETPTWLRGSGE